MNRFLFRLIGALLLLGLTQCSDSENPRLDKNNKKDPPVNERPGAGTLSQDPAHARAMIGLSGLAHFAETLSSVDKWTIPSTKKNCPQILESAQSTEWHRQLILEWNNCRFEKDGEEIRVRGTEWVEIVYERTSETDPTKFLKKILRQTVSSNNLSPVLTLKSYQSKRLQLQYTLKQSLSLRHLDKSTYSFSYQGSLTEKPSASDNTKAESVWRSFVRGQAAQPDPNQPWLLSQTTSELEWDNPVKEQSEEIELRDLGDATFNTCAMPIAEFNLIRTFPQKGSELDPILFSSDGSSLLEVQKSQVSKWPKCDQVDLPFFRVLTLGLQGIAKTQTPRKNTKIKSEKNQN